METPSARPDDWEEQLIHFSLGAMEPNEAAQFEAALEQCRSRALLANSYGHVTGLLGASAPTAEPPTGHKARLMGRVAATPQVAATPVLQPGTTAVIPEDIASGRAIKAPRPRSAAWVWGAVAAAALLVAVAAWLVVALGTVSRQAERIAQIEGSLEALQSQVNIPEGFRTIALSPTAEYTGVSAVVIFNPESFEAWLVADGLEPLPEDFIYELWLIRPQGQGPSEIGGVFGPTPEGSAVHRTEAGRRIAEYAGFAVSIERKPGVAVREGPVVIVGRFESQ
jgi:anti-sigma-K factor RskA